MSYEVRVPEEILLAYLPAWIKMVWISARSYQGARDACSAGYKKIGERTISERGNAMSKSQVQRGCSVLMEAGFMYRNSDGNLVCTTPSQGTPPEYLGVQQECTDEDEEGYTTSVLGVHQESTGGTPPVYPRVHQESTPSKNQQTNVKTNVKTNRVKTHFADDDWQMVFAATAYDRLTDLKLIPESMARKRAATLQAFADEFDKLRRLDEFDQETIREVMRWLLSPTNWWIQTANFRSVLKLRKPHKDGGTYFEHFLSQVRTNARPKQSNHTSYSADDAASIYAAALAGASSAGA